MVNLNVKLRSRSNMKHGGKAEMQRWISKKKNGM